MNVLTLLLMFPFIVVNDASQQYKASLLSVKECENPELPYIPAENKAFEVFLEAYNSSKGETLIRGNVTVKEDIKNNYQLGGLSYGLETPKGINFVYELKNLGCNNFVTKTILSTLGIPFGKMCLIRKGTYIVKSVNVEKIEHTIQGSMARKYGVWVAIFYLYNKTYTMTCWRVRLSVQPVKTKKTH